MEERSGTLRRVVVAIVLATAIGCLLAPSALAGKKPKKHVRDTTTWLCKPGLPDNPCEPGFSTTLLSPSGQITGTQDVKADRKRKIDCFYVYPTVSDHKTPIATSRSIQRSARSRSTRRRATASTAASSPRCTDRSPCRGSSAPGSRARSAADRLRRRARRLEELSAQVQPGPRRGPDRPLPGQLRPAAADPQGGRPEADRAQAPGLGDPARRQRDRAAGSRRRRRLPAHPRLPSRNQTRLRHRVLDLQRPGARPTRSSGDRPSRAGRPGDVLCTNPAALGGGSARTSTPSSPRSRSRPARRSAPATSARRRAPARRRDHAVGRARELRRRMLRRTTTPTSCRSARVARRPGAARVPDATWGLHLTDANIALGNLTDDVAVEAKAWLKKNGSSKKQRPARS